MRSALIVFVIAVLVALAYLLQTTHTDESLDSSVVSSPAPGTDSPPAIAAPQPADALEQEAIAYIRDITEKEIEPVAAETADNFVRSDQTISLIPDESVELKTYQQILSDPDINPDSPITVVRESEEIVMTTPKRLLIQAGGELDRRVQILEDDQVRELSLRELKDQYAAVKDQPLSVIQRVEHIEIMSAEELHEEQASDPERPVKVITKPYHLDSTTVGELLLVNDQDAEENVFYVRSVRPQDTQGIWGIVQAGLIDNFARGIAIRRDQSVELYQVDIPRDADEQQQNQSSSFLGKLIYEKAQESFVYNFQQGRMGKNPDLIHPGQELVIIRFSNQELIAIYKHFVSQAER